MDNQNISDLIETYLKQILERNEKIEIRRAEMADQFHCVPSQINYVIKTRFTIPKGYVVESKRGGGGYIRIIKIKLSNDTDILSEMENLVGDRVSQDDAFAIIQQLYENEVLSKREGNLILSVLSKQILQMDLIYDEEQLRARLLQAFLERLGYEEAE